MRPTLFVLPFAFAALVNLPALAESTPTANAPTDDYTLTLDADPIKVGEAGALNLTITPKAPWKWNAEYPARLEIAPASAVSFDKALLTKKDGDFTDKGTVVGASAAFKGSSAGAHKVTVKGRFGLCDANVCIIKRVDTNATVQVL